MKKKINLIQVVLSLDIGGLEYLVLNLSQKLNRDKYNLSICCLSEAGGLESRFCEIGVPVYHVKKDKGIDFSLFWRLAKLFKMLKIDMIHTHNHAPWFYSVLAGKLAGVRNFVHTEHSNVSSQRKMMLLAERFLAIFTNVVISDSEKVTHYLIEEQRIDPKKILTILNGININRFQGNKVALIDKKSLNIKDNSLVVGNVARLEPVKNHTFLIDVFKEVCSRVPNAMLVVVGGGSELQNLKIKAEQLGIAEKVNFVGTRTDVPEIIRFLDLFVLPSLNEGLSLSLLEAMAAGKPVVATNVGGNPEVVLDGETGILVPLDSKDAMVKAIVRLLREPMLAQRMGKAGLNRVRERFSLESMVEKYESVYDGLYR